MGMQFDEELADDEVSVIVIATDFVNEDGEADALFAGAAAAQAAPGMSFSAPADFGGDDDINKLINILNSSK